jgi:hypothetical protein
MEPKSFARGKPEEAIRTQLKAYLEVRGWFVIITHGNAYQSGLPDLYATHKKFGGRWIEVKLPGMVGSKFTNAQLEVFPKLCLNGSPVWVLTGATKDEYDKLFTMKQGNFEVYLIQQMYKR